MKKAIAILAAAVLLAGALAGCGNGGGAGDVTKIGVIQLAPHPALDAAYEGFVSALAEAGYVDGEQIKIDLQNAQGEISNCPTIASKLVNDKNDLILAIATPAAQAVAEKTQDIPILVTAVTDPAAANLVQTNEMPGTNVSGTSDLTPVAQQLALLKELAPDVEKVGFLYSSSEANSLIQIGMAKEAADDLGLSYQEFTVSNTNEIQSVVQSMVGKVDAIYTPTDNMIATAVSTVSAIAIENKLPFIGGEEAFVDGGALASVSIDYYNLGVLTGKMAVKIIAEGANPAEMPIKYQTDYATVVNEDTAAAIGIEVPEKYRAG